MGWSDVTISLNGPIVGSLLEHFADRWYVRQYEERPSDTSFAVSLLIPPRNFIFDEKYSIKDQGKYARIARGAGDSGHHHLDMHRIHDHLDHGVRRFMGGHDDRDHEDRRDHDEHSGPSAANIQLCRR
jgi:phospholipase D1/2